MYQMLILEDILIKDEGFFYKDFEHLIISFLYLSVLIYKIHQNGVHLYVKLV